MQAAIYEEEEEARRRAQRVRNLSARIVQAQRGNIAIAANADGLDSLRGAQWLAADLYARIYTDPDWHSFPWWRRLLNAVSLRPFLALERQFFIKPRKIFDHLLASQQQATNTIIALQGRLDRQGERVAVLTERIVALEALLAAGRRIAPRGEASANVAQNDISGADRA